MATLNMIRLDSDRWPEAICS